MRAGPRVVAKQCVCHAGARRFKKYSPSTGKYCKEPPQPRGSVLDVGGQGSNLEHCVWKRWSNIKPSLVQRIE